MNSLLVCIYRIVCGGGGLYYILFIDLRTWFFIDRGNKIWYLVHINILNGSPLSERDCVNLLSSLKIQGFFVLPIWNQFRFSFFTHRSDRASIDRQDMPDPFNRPLFNRLICIRGIVVWYHLADGKKFNNLA